MQLTMKILKLISIVSYMMICSIDPKGFPIFVLLLIYLVDFFQSFTYNNLEISWNSFITCILTIGTLSVFLKCRKYKDKYLLIFCFISLLLSTIIYTGILNPSNYYYQNQSLKWFAVPFFVFVLSSLSLIILNFKRVKN